jgi:putative DNA primase/helicase
MAHPGGAIKQSSRKLAPEHLADLRRSGLSDSTIAACGFYTTNDLEEIRTILRWRSYSGTLGACMVLPYANAEGTLNGYARLKPSRPRKDKQTGKLNKYEAPAGTGNRAYFPPGTVPVLSDPSVRLLLVEGEKKACMADQEGFRTIAIPGVYSWQKARPKNAEGNAEGERELIDDLVAVAWDGRHVTIVYDSDGATNPNVRWAEHHLAKALEKRGAKVTAVRLPPGPVGADGKPAKVGLDDYLVAHGPDAFRKLLDAAVRPTAPKQAIEATDDPHRLARLYKKKKGQRREGPTLYFYREEWWRYEDHGAYRVLPKEELRAEVTSCVKAEMDRLNILAQEKYERDQEGVEEKKKVPPPPARKVTSRLVGDVVHNLASMCILPSQTGMPAWLGGSVPFPADEVLAAPNLLVHLPSLVAGREFSCAATPRFFSTNVLDYPFDRHAPRPAAWLKFLRQLWPNDPASIDLLQEWFGYLLTCDTGQQKILMMVGPKRSGKGTVARVLRKLVGEAGVAGPTLSSLGTNFGLWPLIGKALAVVSDARLSGRTDSAMVTERLLSISGEDALTIDRKNLSPVTLKLPTRFMILTNELPKLGDASGALAGRMLLLRLTRSWFGQEDTTLTDRLYQEMGGILLWSIAGWQRLRERGHFLQPASVQDLLTDLEDLSSPVGAFVRECCLVGEEHEIFVRDLYDRWKRWCEEKGRKDPGLEHMFGRDLRAAVPQLGVRQPRVGESRVRKYVGLRLRPEEEAVPDFPANSAV